MQDHCVLLCSILLGLGRDAYVCVGTVTHLADFDIRIEAELLKKKTKEEVQLPNPSGIHTPQTMCGRCARASAGTERGEKPSDFEYGHDVHQRCPEVSVI